MTKIFAIRNDGYSFQELDLIIDDVIDSRPAGLEEDRVLDFSLANTAMGDWWPNPDTEFTLIDDDPNAPIPDLAKWIDASLVVSPNAYRLLGDILREWGELLPVTVKGEIYYLFNCLTLGQVEEQLCEKSFYERQELGIKSIVFDDADVQNKLVFKTTYNSCFELYCNERFKSIVESLGLSGIIFSEELAESFN